MFCLSKHRRELYYHKHIRNKLKINIRSRKKNRNIDKKTTTHQFNVLKLFVNTYVKLCFI